MYIGASKSDDNKGMDYYKRIDTFLLAYELGAMGECKFRERLLQHILNKYGVQIPSEGLAKQLNLASKKANQEVSEFFINESMEVLIEESDKNNCNKFVAQKRKQLIEQLEQFPIKMDTNWFYNFLREIRELKDWKGVNLSNKEIYHSERLIDAIHTLIKENAQTLKYIPEDIVILKDILLANMNEYVR